MGESQLLQLLDLMSKMYGKLMEDAFFFFSLGNSSCRCAQTHKAKTLSPACRTADRNSFALFAPTPQIGFLRINPSGGSSTNHVHHLGVDGLCDDIPVVGDVLHHFAQRRPLHFLPFQVAERVGQEVEENAALPQLLDEELLLLCRSHI